MTILEGLIITLVVAFYLGYRLKKNSKDWK